MRTYEEYSEWLQAHLKQLEVEGVRIFKLSTTEREEFKRCRRRWDFASLSRQGLEPKRPAHALWFGTGIHLGLEKYYGENLDPSKVFREWGSQEIERLRAAQGFLWVEEINAFEETIDLGCKMLENYVAWAQERDPQDFVEVIYTEKEFQVPVRDLQGNIARFTDAGGQVWEIHLVGRLDMIVRDSLDRIWLQDHKTSKDKLDPEILIHNDQMVVYLWAAQEIFQVPFAGAFYNVLRKKLPTVPRVLANGRGLSQDKNIDTTYEVYYNAIVENGFDPEDYSEILEHLKSKPNTFFQREKVRKNQHEIRMAGAMLYLEAVDMLNSPFIYPNKTWDCKWDCDFAKLCLSIDRGDDTAWMLEHLYQKRTPEEGSVYNRERTDE